MKILNFGSMNLDDVFSVDHIVAPGETIASSAREIIPGGKGLNQSIALARAGAEVYHAGAVGRDGEMLLQTLQDAGVHTEYIRKTDGLSGNAIIQVDANGQNSIILFAGANHQQETEDIDAVLGNFDAGDLLLLQNEINLVHLLIEKAYEKGMTIALNPSPFNDAMNLCDMSKVSLFLLNEIEGEQITGKKKEEEILREMGARFPKARVVLTLGGKGVLYRDEQQERRQAVYRVKAVDTTAAGDTFTGYFLYAFMNEFSVQEALAVAAKAAAVSVSRKGASSSIPTMQEIRKIELAAVSHEKTE